MLRSIRPKKIKGLSPNDMEISLEKFLGYPVWVDRKTIVIGPITDYNQGLHLYNDAKALYSNLGTTHVVGTREGVKVIIDLNPLSVTNLFGKTEGDE